jgi:hypothetical protein
VSARILVVTTVPLEGESLRERLSAHAGEGRVEVRVVAPAADLSVFDWLAGDEAEARAEAGKAAEHTGREAAVSGADAVEAEIGDTDPVQAIEDALRTFPADELLLVTHPDDEAPWLEEGAAEEAFARFDLPVTHVVVED